MVISHGDIHYSTPLPIYKYSLCNWLVTKDVLGRLILNPMIRVIMFYYSNVSFQAELTCAVRLVFTDHAVAMVFGEEAPGDVSLIQGAPTACSF